jgi:cyclopropane-fatty-acyl-phospholipid synthase
VRALFTRPFELSLGEAFIQKDLDIEGDINTAFNFADYLMQRSWGIIPQMRFAMRLFGLPKPAGTSLPGKAAALCGSAHSKDRDRQAISHHYDLSNDFYSLWLDDLMVYSCAYFLSAEDDLNAAQCRKLDYVCRKLRLRPGQRLLDIGCGWGGLLLHAARRYGVEARGITLSRAQADFAKERIRTQRLDRKCSVELCDYRDLADRTGFDKIVSIGMFEHVGEKLLPLYFRKAWSLLKPGGVFLNHGIASNPSLPHTSGSGFTDRYVFPDGELLPLSTMLQAAEMNGFEVRDVESLREHYALTLREWVRRLERRWAEACRLTDEATCRIWKLYMAGSAHGFTAGRLNVYQTLFLKTNKGSSRLPLTRSDWYVK